MVETKIHREDVKALLRKRYGSMANFAQTRGIDAQALRDLLRGKSNAVKALIATELGVEPDHLVITSGYVPICGTYSKADGAAHRLSSGVKKTAAKSKAAA